MSKAVMVSINVLDKEYQINCPPEEKDALVESAKQLDERMSGIRDNGKVVGLDRIAVMAALNTTYELLQNQKKGAQDIEGSSDKLARLSHKIDDALNFCRQMEI